MLIPSIALAPRYTQEIVFRDKTDLQSLAVRVTDRRGGDVRGLAISDFTLLEDGHPQKISFFAEEHQPVSLAILIDSSSSMNTNSKIGRIGSVLAPLLSHSNPEDETFLLPFSDHVGPFRQLPPAQRLDPSAAVPQTAGGTALYDALATALCRLRTAKNLQRIIVVITDGLDQNSRLKFQQLLSLTQSSAVQIFMIGFYDRWEYDFYRDRSKRITLASGQQTDNPIITFERLSKESGAAAFFPNSPQELVVSVIAIANILNAQYVLAYYPESDAKVHKIQVRVSNKGYRVSSRQRVGIENGESAAVHFVEPSCQVSPKAHPYSWEPLVTQAGSKTFYNEDFSNQESGWPNYKGSRYKSGFYELSQSSPSDSRTYSAVVGHLSTSQTDAPQIASTTSYSVEGVLAANGPWWSNFRASVHIQSEDGLSAGGMVFHLNDRGYYAALLADNGRANELSFKLIEKTFGSTGEKELIPWTSVIVPVPVSVRTFDHTIWVECNGSTISLRLDGQNAAEIHNNQNLSSGLIGFALFGTGSERFSNLRVESLN